MDDPASSCARECFREVKSRNSLAALGRKC
uniref:Uncharacterized protein n=1 Tax=Siphoviridae sp. ct86u1 TaxID=2827789 RepID=A0A8S5T5W7_9CAUD|nr:MAG TPA: hypothetical protein [Siphoviridae sp. ct86u1]